MFRKFCIKLTIWLGLWKLAHFSNRHNLTIALYHGVAPKNEQGVYKSTGKFIEPEAFAKQLHFFSKNYTILSLEKALALLASKQLPLNSLAITFDDGYQNFYSHAFPILKEAGATATFFLTTDFVLDRKPLWVDRVRYALAGLPTEQSKQFSVNKLKTISNEERLSEVEKLESSSSKVLNNFLDDRQPYAPLTIEQIKEMTASGMTFGAHTASHPILSKIKPEMLKYEIEEATLRLKNEIGEIVSSFCYPNGQAEDFDLEVERIVKESGFKSALTTLEGTNHSETDVFKIKRITIDSLDDPDLFIFAVSGLRLKLRKLILRR